MWKSIELTGWGRAQRSRSLAARPVRDSDLVAALAAAGSDTLIARGAGCSYGDQALNTGGRALLSQRMDRLLDFTEAKNDQPAELVCEAGVSFSTLLQVFLPRGYTVPVTPGSARVTVGGAIANDVHGKNHYQMGSFGSHLSWVELMLPNGEVVRTSRSQDPELFAATIGGMGLTGFILRACFRMQRVPASSVVVAEQGVAEPEAWFELLNRGRTAPFSVAWLDCSRDSGFGRGVMQTANWSVEVDTEPCTSPPALRLPCAALAWGLNRYSVRCFNAVYYRRRVEAIQVREQALADFLYPLDRLAQWNRLYGRRGFRQFQCVIPHAQAQQGIEQLLRTVRESGLPAYLSVLKAMGQAGEGYFSFPLPGISLAMDFPCTERLPRLMSELLEMTLAYGGRLYLAKDTVLAPEAFRRMYPRYREFEAVRARIDPAGRLSSDMARRLQLS